MREHRFVTDIAVKHGGDDAGPSPGEFFVASLATCAGMYASSYCKEHGLDPTGATVEMDWKLASVEGMPGAMRISEIALNVSFPNVALDEATEAGLREAMGHCTVQNSIINRPRMEIGLKGA